MANSVVTAGTAEGVGVLNAFQKGSAPAVAGVVELELALEEDPPPQEFSEAASADISRTLRMKPLLV